jgi:hypothetical protein
MWDEWISVNCIKKIKENLYLYFVGGITKTKWVWNGWFKLPLNLYLNMLYYKVNK